MRAPFDVLGIEPGATEEELERAYRRRVKEAHPDQGGSASEFLLVRAAYNEIRTGTDADSPLDPPSTDSEASGIGTTRVEYLDYQVLTDHGWDLDDEDLFEKATDAGLEPPDRGCFEVQATDPLLSLAEGCGFTWPYACRGGACANCAIAVLEGDLSMPVDHILPAEMTDRGIRLSCVGRPTTPSMKVVYNVKHLPALDNLRLPPYPFEQAGNG